MSVCVCARTRFLFVFVMGEGDYREDEGILRSKGLYCTLLHCTEERTKKIEALRRFSYLEGWNEGRNRQGLATGMGEGIKRDQPLEWGREQRNFSH